MANAPRKPVRYLRIAGVAEQLGTSPGALFQLMSRHAGWPQEDAEFVPGRHGKPERGWLPERLPEWKTWKASLPGQGAGGGRPRKPR